MTMINVSPEELREISRLTCALTRLGQDNCAHLCVENVGPEIFGKLLREYMGASGQDSVNYDVHAFPPGEWGEVVGR